MRSIPILMYHSVDGHVDDRYCRWSVTPKRFTEQMAALAKGNYQMLTVTDLVNSLNAGIPLRDRCAVLTFDDGLGDFLTGAVPVLEQFGFAATLYVVAGHVGGTSRWLAPLGEGGRPMLNGPDLRQLVASGIEIGAHSMTHPQLDLLGPGAAADEIRTSRLVLEKIIGAPVSSFAYPHGYASKATRRLTREAGFSSAVRVRHALSSPAEDHFGLSRLIITEDFEGEELISLLEGDSVPVAPPLDRLASDCWRIARRIQNIPQRWTWRHEEGAMQ